MSEDQDGRTGSNRFGLAAQSALAGGTALAFVAALVLNVMSGRAALLSPQPPATLGLVALERSDAEASSLFDMLEGFNRGGSPVIGFARDELGEQLLERGWFVAEEWGVWASGGTASLLLPAYIGDLPVSTLRLDFRAFCPPGVAQEFAFSIDGQEVARTSVAAQSETLVPISSLVLVSPGGSEDAVKRGFRVLEIETLRPLSPADAGVGPDLRELGFGLSRITLNPALQPPT
jgi:hypothetical protein